MNIKIETVVYRGIKIVNARWLQNGGEWMVKLDGLTTGAIGSHLPIARPAVRSIGGLAISICQNRYL